MLQIDAIDKPANSKCQHCEAGCAIHSTKPQTCADYECAYYQGANVPVSLRPDKCGIIFTKKTDRIFSGILVTGVPVTDVAKGQIQSFNEQGFSVVLMDASTLSMKPMLSADHNPKEIEQEFKEAVGGDIFD
jgi:hypothetical protein